MTGPSVAMVSSSNAFSGNATRISNLSRHIGKTKIFFSGPRRETDANVTFTHFSSRILSMKEKSLKILMDDSEIVHCFKTLPTSGIPSLMGKIRGKPLILDWDDFEGFGGFADQDPFPYNYIADRFEKWVVKRAGALTVVSPFLEKKAREFGFGGPIHFIPNGADTENIEYSFPGKGEKLKLLFVGLLHKSSELDLSLRAMQYLEDHELTVVGDGPRRKEFESLSEKLGLKNVSFLGMKNREDVKKHLYSSDVALLPFVDNISNRSRSPVKLGEYLAAGKPIVTNPVGVVKDTIKNGKNGMITKCEPRDFARGVSELENSRKRKKISLNARKTAEQMSWRKIASKLSEVYETCSKK